MLEKKLLKPIIFISLIAFSISLQDTVYCPKDHYLRPKYTCKKCPNDAFVTIDGKCECKDEEKFFDIETWQCYKCPSETDYDPGSYNICKCKDDTKRFNKNTRKCEEKKYFPCNENYYYEFDERRNKICVKCPGNSKSSGEESKCTCEDNKIWNEDTKNCETCAKGVSGLICNCDETQYWNTYSRKCENIPKDAKKIDNQIICTDPEAKFDKKTNECKVCGEDALYYADNDECYCKDFHEYFNYTTWKCEDCKKHSIRTDFYSQSCSCLDDYFKNDKNECEKCKNGKMSNICICKDDEYFDYYYFYNCRKCPQHSHLNLNNECECEEGSFMYNRGKCLKCPEDAFYTKKDESDRFYDDFYMTDSNDNYQNYLYTCECPYGRLYNPKTESCSEKCDFTDGQVFDYECVECPGNSTSNGEKFNCKCNTDYYWDFEKEECHKRGVVYSYGKYIKITLGILLIGFIF